MSTVENLDTHFLDGRRFTDLATEKFILPASKFNAAEQMFINSKAVFTPADPENNNGDLETSSQFVNLIQWYLTRFAANQQPRIRTLQRYYVGDNSIHYSPRKRSGIADNKIAASFPRYITNLKSGYFLGNPIEYKPDTEKYPKFSSSLNDFNNANSIDYHDKLVKKDLSICGRAYELLYVNQGTNDVKITRVDPLSAFCIYDSTIDQNRLCGVRFYEISTFDSEFFLVDVYTQNYIYHFETSSDTGGDFVLSSLIDNSTNDETGLPNGIETNLFNGVPLVEFYNNEEEIGDWEFELDDIDAYDRAVSEMANSQENFTNSKLVITGEFDDSSLTTDPSNIPPSDPFSSIDGEPTLGDQILPNSSDSSETGSTQFIIPKEKLAPHPNINGQDLYLWLKPYYFTDPVNGGTQVIQPKAEYLTKELNSAGWQNYINVLSSNILQMTGTPDTTDESFSSNSSGVALSYKLFGSDQDRKMQESLFSQAILQRLKLLSEYWQLIEESEGDNSDGSNLTTDQIASSVKLVYTPNLPKSDAEVLAVIQGINGLNKVSSQTILEMISKLTGVSQQQEQQRLDSQSESESDQESNYDPATFAQQVAQQNAQQQIDPRIQAIANMRKQQSQQENN